MTHLGVMLMRGILLLTTVGDYSTDTITFKPIIHLI